MYPSRCQSGMECSWKLPPVWGNTADINGAGAGSSGSGIVDYTADAQRTTVVRYRMVGPVGEENIWYLRPIGSKVRDVGNMIGICRRHIPNDKFVISYRSGGIGREERQRCGRSSSSTVGDSGQ